MSANNFCENLGTELQTWANTLAAIAEKFESRPGHAKVGVMGNIEDIRMLVEDLRDRIQQLQQTCSLEGFDDILTERERDLRAQINVREEGEAVSTIGGGNFGG